MLLLDLISSKNNPKIKETSKLFCSSKFRSQNGLFVIEGLRLCVDAYKSGVKIKTVYVTESFLNKSDKEIREVINSAAESYVVTSQVMLHISDTVSPQGIVCVCENINPVFEVCDNCRIISLFNVADPSNLGTISRTAEAFGINAMVVCGGCDIYNPKALRASMGAIFRLPIITFSEDEAFKFFEKNHIKSYASTPRNDAKRVTDIDFDGKLSVLIGNEANGLPDSVINKCDQAITIPMNGRAESLNAAAAASVLMFEMVRGDL